MANPPQGWKQGNQPNIYEANIKQVNISTGSISLVGETNKSNGSYTVYSTSGINYSGGRTPLYTVSSSGARTVQNSSVYNQLQQSGEIARLDSSIKPRAFEINRTFGTQDEKQSVTSSTLYKSLANASAPAALNPPPAPILPPPERTNNATSGLDPAKRYQYPLTMSGEQDYIEFTIWKIKRSPSQPIGSNVSALASGGSSFGDDTKDYDFVGGPIIIGIQGPIVDQNTVDWGTGQLNELQKMLVQASATTMLDSGAGGITAAFQKGLDSIFGKVSQNQTEFRGLLYSYLLEQATGVPGLTSRLTGGVLNPNLELLFQGPLLRPFNFTFKMSPREKDEAVVVRSIINAFKRNMAPRVNNLFLQSPYVFKIKYMNGNRGQHKSLNLMKMCALQNCSVDYTPLGSYMTYDNRQDPNASMVSYTMTLTFSEITPIYQQDYDSHPIGF